MYETFDTFLQAAVRAYYQRSGTRNRTRLVALVVVSGEVVPLAMDAMKEMVSPGRLAAGALGAVALRAGLKWLFAGPLGLVATGLTVASMVTFYFMHQHEIMEEANHTREVVERTRTNFESIQDRFAAGTFTADERTLLLDGLLQRFLREMDEPSGRVVDVAVREHRE